MVEDLAEAGAKPGTDLNKVYHQWSHGNWGLILTGNVMVDSNQLGSTHNVLAVPGTTDTSNVASDRDKNLLLWKAWAESIQVRNTPALMQLNHPGRRALRYSRKGPALAPSAMSLNLGRGFFAQFLSWLAFGAPRAMTKADIEDTVRRFAAAAKFACDAGFKGVEIHAAHGYLLAQFLSTETNRRTDEYGGTAFNRARLLREVVQNIRQVVPRSFSVGIKLNTVDCQAEESLHDTLEQIGSLIDIGGVDFLDISGGTYEHPQVSVIG